MGVAMRITTVRILVQILVMGLFLAFCLMTTFAFVDEHHGQYWVSKFLEIDPLVGISTTIATSTLYKGLIWGLVLLIPTVLLGRIFCNWICPYGILHQFFGWAFNSRDAKAKIESNRYRRIYAIKYYILIAMGVALLGQFSLSILMVGCAATIVGGLLALFAYGVIKDAKARRPAIIAIVVAGVLATLVGASAMSRGDWNGSLQIGLLDPICLIHRSFTAAILPAMNLPDTVQKGALGVTGAGDPRQHVGAWFVGFMIVLLVAMNLFIPRFFCRVLCPLGATLGALSRFALWRIERNPAKCTDCDLCLQSCEGASDPHTQLRKSECFVCFNCIEDCPHDALSFDFVPARKHEVPAPDLRLRGSVLAAVTGFLFTPFARVGASGSKDFSATGMIRPPGSCEENEFLQRCIKCDQCIRVCPTNVLQPYHLDFKNIESLWTPVMNFRTGFCQLNCTACGEVCPTGAIQRIGIDGKLGLGKFAEAGPVVLGTAHYDLGRCLPWSMKKPCVVCEEVCPTSPKAIYSERMQFVEREGKMMVISATSNTVTVGHEPKPGELDPQPVAFRPGRFIGDGTTTYHVEIIYRSGIHETHQIVANDADTLRIDGVFSRPPVAGEFAVVKYEWKVPKIDTDYCIGCGICEHECPVVGDKRAVYVTAEGESRSNKEPSRDRNRGLSLEKSVDARGGRGHGHRPVWSPEESQTAVAIAHETNVAGHGDISLLALLSASSATMPATKTANKGGCCGGGGKSGCGCKA